MRNVYKLTAIMFALIAFYSSQSMSATATNLKCKKCVGTSDIAKNAVTGSRIKDGAVTLDKLDSDVLDALGKVKVSTVAPAPGDDLDDGYSEGTIWVDLTDKTAYILIDKTAGQAVWKPITSGPGIVGSWYLGSDNRTLITFLDGSNYFVTQDIDDGGEPMCSDGMESGTYTLNSATGQLGFTNVIDTTGDCGLTSTQGDTYDASVDVSGHTIIITDSEGSFPLTRVADASNAIVGGWYVEGANKTLITFLDGSNYFVAQDIDEGGEPTCSDGIEFGSYTWDSGTGTFSLANVVDTTGDCGLTSVQGDVYDATNVVSGGTLTITDIEGSFSLNLVQ